MTDKIIDIRKYMPQESEEDEGDYIEAAIELLGHLDPDTAGIITKGITDYIILEMEIGLGLRPYPEEVKLQFYPKIMDCYRMAGLRTIFEVDDCKNWKQVEPAKGFHCYNCANKDGNPWRAQPDENCKNWKQ